MYGRKQRVKITDNCLGWVISKKLCRSAMFQNGRPDSAFLTQGDWVNRSFARESNAISEALRQMVPSKNNKRNQYNYCCKLTHFFLKTVSRFTSYSYITKDYTATELHSTANSPQIQHVASSEKTEVLTSAQILVTKNKPETQELLHSYFFF